jgi:hypothetical protein
MLHEDRSYAKNQEVSGFCLFQYQKKGNFDMKVEFYFLICHY